MLDLKPIKKRLKAHRRGEYRPVPVNEGAQWLMDIEALVEEVGRLRKDRDEWKTVAMLNAQGNRPGDELQPCGHPRSAIIKRTDIGGEYNSDYCGICNAEAEAEVRRDDRIMDNPESEPLPEPREEEAYY
jgi:hypothetical protein